MGPRNAVEAEEKLGDKVRRYKLLQKIGEGRCGAVWMAEQEEPVRGRVRPQTPRESRSRPRRPAGLRTWIR